ncbi:unnamed protein product [Periconia digitata]|uniref:Uncharacterized protein n=1 Tax=Periconia digitata TaxID=1303443 RepID=A0A9W4U573_9PLEO|nr:unnamed protein product [Periconia digitata]
MLNYARATTRLDSSFPCALPVRYTASLQFTLLSAKDGPPLKPVCSCLSVLSDPIWRGVIWHI